MRKVLLLRAEPYSQHPFLLYYLSTMHHNLGKASLRMVYIAVGNNFYGISTISITKLQDM